LKILLHLAMHTARIPPLELAAATITAVPAMHAGHIGLSSMDFQSRPLSFRVASRPEDLPLRELVQDILWFDAGPLFLGHARA
jgi:hypothetical protein